VHCDLPSYRKGCSPPFKGLRGEESRLKENIEVHLENLKSSVQSMSSRTEEHGRKVETMQGYTFEGKKFSLILQILGSCPTTSDGNVRRRI
jgi:hypothetical protein